MRKIFSFEKFNRFESGPVEVRNNAGDVCRVCGCECDVCECNVCECEDTEQDMDKYVESSEWDMELSPQLIDAIDNGDMKSVQAMLDAGADMSYRHYYPITRAIKAATKAKGDRNAFDNAMEILDTLMSELDYISPEGAEEALMRVEDAPASVGTYVRNKLDEIEIVPEKGQPVQEKKSTKRKKGDMPYWLSGLKNPEKADLDKDKKISGYEKARGKAVQKSVQKEGEKGSKGLTAGQKKLPPALQKAILARKKKKN